jgi:Spy/CpxP family protein refolding chaperone
MKINKISMAIIAAAAALAVCPAVHAQDDTNKPATETPAPRPRGGMSVDTQMERIDKAVTLTDDEKPKVKSAVEDMIKAMQEARTADQDERASKRTAAREDFSKKMKDILTPDQYTKFQAMPRPGRRGGGGGAGAGGANPGNSPAGN